MPAHGTAESSKGAEPVFSLQAHELRLELSHPEFGPIPVRVAVPARKTQAERLPLLIAFHGRGESTKGPERGVSGWFDDYALLRTIDRLQAPPLTREDFEGFVAKERLSEVNERLATRAFRPLIVATPYLPDMLGGRAAFDLGPKLGDFVVDELLPALRAKTPASDDAAQVGVDGVSLGGRASLLIGLTHPSAFGAVGALQAAVDETELDELARLASEAQRANSKLQIRLVTSWGDYYVDVLKELQRRFERRGVESELLVTHGTHSYQFNRGPGGYEMLLFHEAALRR